ELGNIEAEGNDFVRSILPMQQQQEEEEDALRHSSLELMNDSLPLHQIYNLPVSEPLSASPASLIVVVVVVPLKLRNLNDARLSRDVVARDRLPFFVSLAGRGVGASMRTAVEIIDCKDDDHDARHRDAELYIAARALIAIQSSTGNPPRFLPRLRHFTLGTRIRI
ncbi:hypothetical protein FOZ63_033594, partial [Perkinsus olseni]